MGSDDSETENRERVLAPDDLDITDQPEVAEIDDGRYVVSADGPAKQPDERVLENPDWLSDDGDDEAATPTSQEPSPQSDQSPPADRSRQPPADSQPNRSQPNQNRPNQNQPNQNQPNHSRSDQRQPSAGGQPEQGQPTQSHPDQQQPNRGQPNRGQSNQQQPNRGQPTQSPPDQQQPNRANSNQQPTRDQPNQGQPGREQQPATDRQQDPRQQQSTGGRSASSQPAADDRQQPAGGQGESSAHPNSSELAAHDQPPVEPPAAELTNENVSKFLAKELTQGSGDYGFDATLNVEGQVNRGRMTSDDIGETLETLLRWYANQTTDEVDTEAVLGIILAGTDLAVEYPVQSAYTTVKRYGLTPEDSIGDLLRAIRKEGSFTVPPSKD